MELVTFVGVPIVCFVFGFIIGSYHKRDMLNKVSDAGVRAGAAMVDEAWRVQISRQQEVTEEQPYDNETRDQSYGFDLKMRKDYE